MALRHQADWGAQKVTITDSYMRFEFYTIGGKLIDSYRLAWD